MRDALSMQDAGAVAALTFNDAGIASTHAGMTVPAAKGIFNRLAGSKPDVIVAELGDGILGEYGVQDILRDAELMRVGVAYVMAAPDPVGCWGAVALMRGSLRPRVTVLTGPATDNEVGRDYITRRSACRRTTRCATRRSWSASCGAPSRLVRRLPSVASWPP